MEISKIVLVKVTPSARQNKVIGWENGELKVHLTTTPEKGKANEDLLILLAEYFGVKKSAVELISGGKSRHKKIRVQGEIKT